jgi:hypothetical protein
VRLLPEARMAETIGLDLATFRRWVAYRHLPEPFQDTKPPLWDSHAVHLALDRLSGIGSPTTKLDGWREKRNARNA